MRRAFVTGITGQDGSYLAELLVEKRYEVHGYVLRSSAGAGTHPLGLPNVHYHVGSLEDPAALRRAIEECQPDEVYNLGAQSHVGASFNEPEYTWRVTAAPVVTILETIRDRMPETRFYQASTSEMFGNTRGVLDEHAPLDPQSPYAVAKVAAHNLVKLYRRAYDLFAVSGILFNHESPRRPPAFVTRKITMAAARIALGRARLLRLGNTSASRDWGFAGDYVDAMWRMLQVEEPEDFVIATGKSHTVREFVVAAFESASQLADRYIDPSAHVESDPTLLRPAEVHSLTGCADKAREKLGWEPKHTFEELVRMMVAHDYNELANS